MPALFRFERSNVSISAFLLGVLGSKLSSVRQVTESAFVWVVWILCGFNKAFNICGVIETCRPGYSHGVFRTV